MHLILFTSADPPSPPQILEQLELLGHSAEVREDARLTGLETADAVVVHAGAGPAGGSLVASRNLLIQVAALSPLPRLAVLKDTDFSVVNPSWPAHEFISESAPSAELEARLRIACQRSLLTEAPAAEPSRFKEAGIEIDEGTYTARIHGKALNLTYKEFELLKFLAGSPDQVFTREQLLSEVWGYDYFGGTRTVDVHVRRLRAKLGSDHETLIRTVRNVGYLFARRQDP